MGIDRRIALLPAAFLSLSSFSLGSAAMISDEAISSLDPSRAGMRVCGSKGSAHRIPTVWLKAAQALESGEGGSGIIPLLPGVIDMGFPVSTKNALAQRYFNQGLLLTYGFNHLGAVRAFREAQRLDPECAMCWWGEALAHGPNINAPMDPETNDRVNATLARAQQLSSGASPVEQALIAALGQRYSTNAGADRAALDKAYADAMFKVAADFPQQDDVQLLTAEAEMDLRPWDYWEADRSTPKGRIAQAVALVEGVLARKPNHPQAAHLYIHLVENATNPQRAEAAADQLVARNVTGAGHLVHMPSHLYYVLGRFKDSLRANVEAARADEAYFKATGERGLYRYGYYPHNVHFIVSSAQMAGDRGTALREAAKLRTLLDVKTTAMVPWLQAVEAAPYTAAAQFDEPKAILAMKPPVSNLPYVVGMWHYARAVAFAHRKNGKGFSREIAEIERIRTTANFKAMTDALMPAPDLLQLAIEVARGKQAYSLGKYADAVSHFTTATKIEDGIWYMEPPYWYYPVRQSLGAALYRAGDLQGARQAYQGAIAKYPNNGWALYGLAKVHQALGDKPNAAATQAAFARAWMGPANWLTVDRI